MLDDPWFKSQQGKEICLSQTSTPALGPTQPPIQWGPRGSFTELSSKGMRLTTHLQLKPRLRMSDATPPLPHMPSLVCIGLILPLAPILQIFCFFLLINSAFNGLPKVRGHISLRRIKANHMKKNSQQQSCAELYSIKVANN